MQIKKDFDYYHNLHNVVTHALLHLLCRVATSSRFVPVPARNEILIKFLKLKLTDKSLSNIKKDLKLMINVARKKGGNLEMRLHELPAPSSSVQKSSTIYWFTFMTLKALNHDCSKKAVKPNQVFSICSKSK